MNPYEAPSSPSSPLVRAKRQGRLGPALVAAVLILAVNVGLLSHFLQAVRSFAIPRFGWIGLIMCLNPLIFLIPWMWSLKRPLLLASAGVLFSIGVINASQLCFTGTVSSVTNEFADRLHSSWIWSVFSFVIAAGYLFWRWTQAPTDPLTTSGLQEQAKN